VSEFVASLCLRLGRCEAIGYAQSVAHMDLRTGSGYPLQVLGLRTKADALPHLPPLAQLISCLAHCDNIWRLFAKRELRKVGKESRVVCSPPVWFVLAMTSLCASFNQRFYDANLSINHAVGTTMFHGGVGQWLQHLGGEDRIFIESDVKAYDSCIAPWLFDIVRDIRIKCCGHRAALTGAYNEIVHTAMVLGDGTLLRKHGGNPSGSPNTTVDNTLVHLLVLHIMNSVLWGGEAKYLAYGDDVIISLPKSQLASASSISSVYASLGFDVPVERVKIGAFHEVSFLGIMFKHVRGVWVGVPATEKWQASVRLLLDPAPLSDRADGLRLWAFFAPTRDLFTQYLPRRLLDVDMERLWGLPAAPVALLEHKIHLMAPRTRRGPRAKVKKGGATIIIAQQAGRRRGKPRTKDPAGGRRSRRAPTDGRATVVAPLGEQGAILPCRISPADAAPAPVPDRDSRKTAVFKASLKGTVVADAAGAFVRVVNPRYPTNVMAGTSVAGAFTYAGPIGVTNIAQMTTLFQRVRCTGCSFELTGSASMTTAQGAIVTAIIPPGEALPVNYAAAQAIDGATLHLPGKVTNDKYKCLWVPSSQLEATEYNDTGATFSYAAIAAGNVDGIMLIAGSGLVVGENVLYNVDMCYEGLPDQASAHFTGSRVHALDTKGLEADAHVRRNLKANGLKSEVDVHNKGVVSTVCKDVGLKPPTSMSADVGDLSKVGKFALKHAYLAALL